MKQIDHIWTKLNIIVWKKKFQKWDKRWGVWMLKYLDSNLTNFWILAQCSLKKRNTIICTLMLIDV